MRVPTTTVDAPYKTRENLLFALLLPERCGLLLERQDILGADPLIASWAESSGAESPLWYRQAQQGRVFSRPRSSSTSAHTNELS